MRRFLFAGALGLLCAVGAPSLERLASFGFSLDRASAGAVATDPGGDAARSARGPIEVAANENRRANARPGRAPRTQAERRTERRRAERMRDDAKRAERAERKRLERRHEKRAKRDRDTRKQAESRAEQRRGSRRRAERRSERAERRPGRHDAKERRHNRKQAEKRAERQRAERHRDRKRTEKRAERRNAERRSERRRAERRWDRRDSHPRTERRHRRRAHSDRRDWRHGRPHGWRPAHWRSRDWRPRHHYRAPYRRSPHPRWGAYHYSPAWDWYFVAPLAAATLVYVATLPEDRPCEGYDYDGERLYACDGVLYRPTSYQREIVYEIVSAEDDVAVAAPPPQTRPLPRELRLRSPMMTGPAVRALQQELAGLGLIERGGIDGVFGPNTDRALRTFQREWSVPATGVFDEETAALLGL